MVEIYWELILAVGLPLGGIALGVGKYFMRKEKCFNELKRTVQALSRHDQTSKEDHDGYEQELADIKLRQQKNEIYLKLLLDKFNVPYNP